MSEGRVTVSVNGKDYPMACQPGEEAKVAALGKKLDETVRKVSADSGPTGEPRLLVMAALIILDSLSELEVGGGKAPASGSGDNGELAKRMEKLAERLEKLASGAPQA